MHTWITAIASYKLALRSGDYPDGTIYLRGYHLRRFAKTVGKKLTDVTREDVLLFLDSPTWAASYKRSFRVTLRAFFRWAKDEHLVKHNPMKGIKSVPAPIGKPRPAPSRR